MIAACPKCQTRYRLRLEQLGERGVRLRCRRCESLFRVLSPPDAAAAATPAPETARVQAPAPQAAPVQAAAPQAAPVQAPAPAPTPHESAPQASATPKAPSPATPGAAPLVLVAHRDARTAKDLADRLGGSALPVVACDDGAQALLVLHRTPPRAAILDAALPGLDGHQICEVLKRNDALAGLGVVVLGTSAADLDDPAAAGFGADLYLDPADCSEGVPARLREVLGRFGVELPAAGAPPSEVAPPAPSPGVEASLSDPETPTPPEGSDLERPPSGPSAPEPPAPVPTPPPAAASSAAADEELARAERLARIAVSDIVLYNEEKFAAALRSGDPLQVMRDEVEEGRSLLRGRIDPNVFEERDFVGEELLRVARERA